MITVWSEYLAVDDPSPRCGPFPRAVLQEPLPGQPFDELGERLGGGDWSSPAPMNVTNPFRVMNACRPHVGWLTASRSLARPVRGRAEGPIRANDAWSAGRWCVALPIGFDPFDWQEELLIAIG